MAKCIGELTAILLYLSMTTLMCVAFLHHLNGGKPLASLMEFGIAICID